MGRDVDGDLDRLRELANVRAGPIRPDVTRVALRGARAAQPARGTRPSSCVSGDMRGPCDANVTRFEIVRMFQSIYCRVFYHTQQQNHWPRSARRLLRKLPPVLQADDWPVQREHRIGPAGHPLAEETELMNWEIRR